MKRIILAALIALTVHASAFAYDFIENGFAFNILKDGTVSLTNKVKDFSYDKLPEQALTYNGAVTVPASVKHAGKTYKVSSIGRNAFFDCRSVTSVVISEGIRTVEEDAFYYCSMKSLTIPASVIRLVPGCLHQCSSLSTITVSPQNANYKSQGNCIYNKTMTQLIFVSPVLKMYKFPATVKSVADYAFNGSTVRRLTIPASVTHIGGMAFYSNDIKEIVCGKPLQKLSGSKDYMPGSPLPVWALSQTAAAAINTTAAMKKLEGRKDLWRPNTMRNTSFDQQIILKTGNNGRFSFGGDELSGTYVAGQKYYVYLEIVELKDYPNATPGFGSYITDQKINAMGVGVPVTE